MSELEFHPVERPPAATTLPQALLDAIAETRKTGKAIAIKAPADDKKARRLAQRIAGLHRRGVTTFRVRTLRQDEDIIVWAEDTKRKVGRPKNPPRYDGQQPQTPGPDPDK